MIEEQAIVVGLEHELALLEVVRRKPCGLCGQTRGCGISLWGRLFSHRRNIVKALNQIGAKQGDSVIVGVDEHAVLTSALTAYGVPLLALLLGALLGSSLTGEYGQPDLYAALGAGAGLILGLLWLKAHAAGRALDPRYRPIILRTDHGETADVSISKCERRGFIQ